MEPRHFGDKAEADEAEMHRTAVLAWIAELDTEYGRANDEERADVDGFLDEIWHG